MREVPLGFLINADFINFKYEDKRHHFKYDSLPSRRKQNNVFLITNIDYDIVKAYSWTLWSSSRENLSVVDFEITHSNRKSLDYDMLFLFFVLLLCDVVFNLHLRNARE